MTRAHAASLTASLAAAAGAAMAAAVAQGAFAPDRPEPGSVEAIARFTTEPRFGNPWVAYVPESEAVPSPADRLGRVSGAPGELSDTAAVYGYFHELDRASARVAVETIGRSEEGRDILLVAISDEQNIRRLPELKRATALLADPRATSPDQAERLLASARPIYYFNAGLHSTETGSPEMVMELAYRLAVSEQPMIRRIRDNVVVLINPVSEPDGRDKMVEWFYRHLKGRTDFEDLPRRSPPYWGHYVFHDNNRDTHQKALDLTRAVHRAFFDYHPTVVHDLHESIPLLHTWNGTGPYNANLDPIVTSEWLEMSFHEVTALTAMGMPGVWTWGFGESWGLHYLDSVASNHNSIGRGYETFGNTTAETVERRLRPDEELYVGKAVTTREWYRAWPPDRSLVWSLRNNVNYMQTGCLAILDWTARHAQDLLRNFYRKGLNSWRKGREGKPRAFAIAADQGDRRRVAEMINLLTGQRIEVGRASSDVTVAEGRFPKGTFVVRLDQPYRNYAVDLLEHQRFPDDATYEPYDDVSWSLPAHFGVEAQPIEDERIAEAALEPVREEVRPAGRVWGAGVLYLLADTGQEALLAARARLSRFKVEIAERPFRAPSGEAGREEEYAAGSWLIPSAPGLRETLEAVAAELSLDFTAWDAASAPESRHDAPLPRLAVWHTWADTEAVGWVRLILDRQKVPYGYIRDEEVRAGRLRDRFDVILHAHVWLDLKGQIHGIDPRHGPLAYTRTAEFPSHGVPDASEDITGGIGWAGMASLQEFLQQGGVLVTLGGGSTLALEGGLARGVERHAVEDLFTPGVELKARFVASGHPLAYGYPEITSVFRSRLPAYDVAPADRRRVILQWGIRPRREDREEDETDRARSPKQAEEEEKEILVSGGVRGADGLEGRPAILDVPVGRGRVLAFNFNPLHRDQNRSDHRLLWNAVLNWKALPAAGS